MSDMFKVLLNSLKTYFVVEKLQFLLKIQQNCLALNTVKNVKQLIVRVDCELISLCISSRKKHIVLISLSCESASSVSTKL